jgi:hypothetical protein
MSSFLSRRIYRIRRHTANSLPLFQMFALYSPSLRRLYINHGWAARQFHDPPVLDAKLIHSRSTVGYRL